MVLKCLPQLYKYEIRIYEDIQFINFIIIVIKMMHSHLLDCPVVPFAYQNVSYPFRILILIPIPWVEIYWFHMLSVSPLI